MSTLPCAHALASSRIFDFFHLGCLKHTLIAWYIIHLLLLSEGDINICSEIMFPVSKDRKKEEKVHLDRFHNNSFT